jgi:hypothetical protein
MRKLILLMTHLAVLAIGFALGIYLLPVLTAPPPPAESLVTRDASSALYTGEFRRDLEDSDFLHWGEGTVYVHDDRVAFEGALAPGPDYRLYFSPQWVETERDFLRLKSTMVEAGDVKTFENFMVSLPPGLDPGDFNTVVVWCESFRQFITAGQYR